MKYILSILLTIGMTSTVFGATSSNTTGLITDYYTGYSSNNIRIKIDGAAYDEVSNCTAYDGYMVHGNSSGYESHTSALLAAYLADKEVKVILDDSACISNRPKIIGVSIEQPIAP